MMITLSRLYPDSRAARAVTDEFKAAGLFEDQIGLIAPLAHRLPLAMAAAGVSAFVLPGIGAVVAAGWLAGALAGAVAGAAAGGVTGVLIEAGIPEKEAARSAEGLRRGGILVAIRSTAHDRAFYEEILAIRDAPLMRRDGLDRLPVTQF